MICKPLIKTEVKVILSWPHLDILCQPSSSVHRRDALGDDVDISKFAKVLLTLVIERDFTICV